MQDGDVVDFRFARRARFKRLKTRSTPPSHSSEKFAESFFDKLYSDTKEKREPLKFAQPTK
jgi:hypothetical protein